MSTRLERQTGLQLLTRKRYKDIIFDGFFAKNPHKELLNALLRRKGLRMLLTFSVSNYKSIWGKQTLSMVGSNTKGAHAPADVSAPGLTNGVLPCAIIYGPNASGKTNLLDALVRMRDSIFLVHPTREKSLRRKPFDLNKMAKQAPTEFEIVFLEGGIRYDYGFSYDDDKIISEYLFSYPKERRRKIFDRREGSIEFGALMRGSKKTLGSFLRPNVLFMSIAAHVDHPELKPVVEFFKNIIALSDITVHSGLLNITFKDNEIDHRSIAFLKAIGTGICDYKQVTSEIPEKQRNMIADVIKVVSSYANDESEIDAPAVDDREYEIQLGHVDYDGDLVYFPSDAESAGTRRLLIMMNYIFSSLDKGCIMVVDEIDASLHTHAVKSIVKLFLDHTYNRGNAQLIATTHDTNLLDPNVLRRDEIWFSQKDRSGSSSYYSLVEINSRKDEGFERQYLQGRYGAVPPSSSFVERYIKNIEE